MSIYLSLDNTKDVSLKKMQNLLKILSDPNEKVTLSMLLRCEQVLIKMDFNKQVSHWVAK